MNRLMKLGERLLALMLTPAGSARRPKAFQYSSTDLDDKNRWDDGIPSAPGQRTVLRFTETARPLIRWGAFA